MKNQEDYSSDDDESFMRVALDEAEQAALEDEIPVGAVCVKNGRVISRAHNARESTHDPTSHAELLAIRRAAKALKTWRLNGCTLYVTLEPCLMCSGAIINSRISRVVFGPYDPKAGALGSLYNVGNDPRLNHETMVVAGVLQENSSKLLSRFFQRLRSH